MQPAAYAVLPKLPRLPTGKLDRHALPAIAAHPERAYRAPSTPAAQRMAQVWQEVLGVEQVGETDNFFELGGDSLLCLKLISRLRALKDERFSFKLRDLMQKPTIASLLGLESAAPGVVALNRSGKEALFCIHAGFGTVFDYQPLARQLDGVATVYGIACRMLSQPGHVDASLEQMAADYAALIRQAQPEGPYRLLGWSLGGTLAAMVAGALEAQGQAVSLLALADPYVAGESAMPMPAWQADFGEFLGIVLPEADLETLRPELETAVAADMEALVTRVLAGEGVGRSALAGMGAAEIVRSFEVARHLKALSIEAGPAPALACTAQCWWVAGRAAAEQAALARQLGTLAGREVAADHYSLLRDEAWLQQAAALLRAEASV
jgi:thioesterase domain-containing protein/aryl carrier-like protein